jgi:hypothetical protein
MIILRFLRRINRADPSRPPVPTATYPVGASPTRPAHRTGGIPSRVVDASVGFQTLDQLVGTAQITPGAEHSQPVSRSGPSPPAARRGGQGRGQIFLKTSGAPGSRPRLDRHIEFASRGQIVVCRHRMSGISARPLAVHSPKSGDGLCPWGLKPLCPRRESPGTHIPAIRGELVLGCGNDRAG